MMDLYHSIHGSDIASFDIAADISHTPPVSAAHVLSAHHAADAGSRIPTGIDALDRRLAPTVAPLASQIFGTAGRPTPGGIARGEVTEIWGPPGSGRTALGIQLATNAMVGGGGVVWIDCFHDTPASRLDAVWEATRQPTEQDADKEATQQPTEQDTKEATRQPTEQDTDKGATAAIPRRQFTRYFCATLPHLLALLSRPLSVIVPVGTTLLVVNGVSVLVNTAVPRPRPGKPFPQQKQASPFAKRIQALQAISSLFNKIAASRNCAVVVLSHCVTKMQERRGGGGGLVAALVPAISATVWEDGVAARLVLFRDWRWLGDGKEPRGVFLAGVEKLRGRLAPSAVRRATAFTVDSTGVRGVEQKRKTKGGLSGGKATTQKQQKRKIAQTELEVPDSQDEDYGWTEGDEDLMPALPPQWQGSEDILLGRGIGQSEEEDEVEDENEGEDGDESMHEAQL